MRLAERAGLPHPFRSRLERGLTRPSMPSLHRIARALGTTRQALMATAAVPRPGTPAGPDPRTWCASARACRWSIPEARSGCWGPPNPLPGRNRPPPARRWRRGVDTSSHGPERVRGRRPAPLVNRGITYDGVARS
ncbi:helix-turn-helix domain-containing protein [Streptomyces sp. QTS52]